MFRKDSNISIEFKSNVINVTRHFEECCWIPLPSEGKGRTYLGHLCSLVDEQVKYAFSIDGINGRPFSFAACDIFAQTFFQT